MISLTVSSDRHGKPRRSWIALARPASMQPSWKEDALDFFTFGRLISRKFCKMQHQKGDGVDSILGSNSVTYRAAAVANVESNILKD